MIRKLEVRNFKKFDAASFDLADRLVIVGPNNCGKTTLLQAISLWAEAWRRWSEDESASGWLRDDRSDAVRTSRKGYAATTVDDIRSVPVSDFADLWCNKNVQEPVVLELRTAEWHVALELHFRTSATMDIRPADAAPERELRTCFRNPLVPVYISSALRLEDDEAMLADDVLPIRLASGRGASVLRNMLLRLSDSDDAWDALVNHIQSLFGYSVSRSSRRDPLRVYYRHSESDVQLEIACAGSGFLQVLLLYSSVLYSRANIILVDEPDMHLHRLLQNEVYGELDRTLDLIRSTIHHDHVRHPHKERDQLIASTHSDVLVDKVQLDRLRSVTNTGLLHVQQKSVLKDALRDVTNSDIHTALVVGRILYVEGDIDVPILKAWAKTIGHPMLSFLEKPFVEQTAEKEGREFAKRHYRALRTVVPSLRGIELRDRNDKNISQNDRDKAMQSTPPTTYWHRYEIEDYLLHPDAILRLVERRGGSEARTCAKAHIAANLPPVVIETPLEDNQFNLDTKGKIFIATVMESAGLRWMDRDCVAIAEEMTAGEVHPEIREKLNELAAKLTIGGDDRASRDGPR